MLIALGKGSAKAFAAGTACPPSSTLTFIESDLINAAPRGVSGDPGWGVAPVASLTGCGDAIGALVGKILPAASISGGGNSSCIPSKFSLIIAPGKAGANATDDRFGGGAASVGSTGGGG